jgi:DNA-binding NtrC family response regulator
MSKRAVGTATIVVVDDEPIALEFCRSTLVRAGYHVLTASSGEQALSHFKSYGSPIDLALVDIVMPGMNGVALVKRIEKLGPGTRIVLMSGYSPDEVRRIVADDASSYRSMWKPFQAATLVQTVKNVLDTPVRMKAASGA